MGATWRWFHVDFLLGMHVLFKPHVIIILIVVVIKSIIVAHEGWATTDRSIIVINIVIASRIAVWSTSKPVLEFKIDVCFEFSFFTSPQ